MKQETTPYRELAVIPKEKQSSLLDPIKINESINNIKNKRSKIPHVEFPKLESLLFWKFRLDREIKSIKKEFIATQLANENSIHHFSLIEKRVSVITLYALYEFHKAGWVVKVSNGNRNSEIFIKDFSSLNYVYNKFIKISSLFITLEADPSSLYKFKD